MDIHNWVQRKVRRKIDTDENTELGGRKEGGNECKLVEGKEGGE